MIDLCINNFDKIIGSILVAVFGGYVAYRTYQKTRFNAAADRFRGVILSELEGIFPVNGFWQPEFYTRIRNTVPVVKRASLEFRPALPFYRKCSFDKATMEYCDQSENLNWEQAGLDAFYGDGNLGKTQKEKFVECVEYLLSFTD